MFWVCDKCWGPRIGDGGSRIRVGNTSQLASCVHNHTYLGMCRAVSALGSKHGYGRRQGECDGNVTFVKGLRNLPILTL